MIGSLLQRMIFGQLVRVFTLALIGLTGLFVLAGLVAEATQRGLAPSQILLVIPLLVPNTLPYTLPATTLFATCIVYGRLAADNEILAVKAAGGKVGSVLRPSLVLGIGAALLTAGLYWRHIPETHRTLRNSVLGDVEELLYGLLKRTGCLRHPNVPFSMWVREVQGRHLVDAVFKQRDASGGYDVVARAREAEIRFDPKTNLIKVEMPRCLVIGENNRGGGVIGHKTWEVPLPSNLLNAECPNRPSDLPWIDLFARKEVVKAEAARMRHEAIHPPIEEGVLPADRQAELRKFRDNSVKAKERERRALEAEIHLRPALAIGCLCFVLVGAPVGIWFGKADYLSAFVTCFLPTVFVYYPLLLCGTNLAKDGTLPVAVGVWLADAVTAGLAIALRYMMLRR